MKPTITITTDFGDSFAAAQLKAVLASENFDGQVIENHDVTDFSITEGAFQILTLTKFSPVNTVHIGVIDPGVGSQRSGIVIRSNKFWFVGPDNGLLYPAAINDGIKKIWKINENKVNSRISTTFHGRDVFIKAGIYLAQRKLPEDFGSSLIDANKITKLSFIQGQVVHTDSYGNLKIYAKNGFKEGKSLTFSKNSEKIATVRVVRTFADVAKGEPLALLGSSGTLELAVNLGNAAKHYSIKTGDILDLELH
ncbi:SAM-dependent chlorinase/fluorinase [Candidatus Gottesmanbacteria bacterium]|nr:SAM-dependent chlorinase/fluorinase [Candidatus Gottesmanbacteria bacterium]